LSSELGGAAYDEATIQSILRDALDVTKPPPPAQTPAEDARKPRKPTLASVAKAASKAGIPVVRYEMRPDGTIIVVTGEPEASSTEPNPWLAEIEKATKQ